MFVTKTAHLGTKRRIDMSKSKEKLFTFDVEERDDGVHIHLGGTLGKSLQSLKEACEAYCCCHSKGCGPKKE